MISYIRKTFAAPSADELAARELADARRELLLAQTDLDHAKAKVQFNHDRIVRLVAYLRETEVS
jgi:hypothetical protein